jgi:hypothetical protein
MTKFARHILATALALTAFVFTQVALSAETAKTEPKPAKTATKKTNKWHTFTTATKNATAEMPAEPKYSTAELKTTDGSPYTMHQYVLEINDKAYVLQTVSYPESVDVSVPKNNLQGGLDNSVKQMKNGLWDSIEWMTQQDQPAVEAIGVHTGGLAIRSYTTMKGRELTTLTYAGPAGTAKGADVTRFMRSLILAK